MVTVGIATMPGREENLRVVIEALLPQADYIVVYSNDPAGPPEWLDEYDRLMAVGPIHGDLTDAGKLYGLDVVWGGHYLVCDDDMVYPPDYVKRIVWGINTHKRERVIGFAGGILAQPPISSYCAEGRTMAIRWDDPCDEDVPVNILLSGLSGWHMDLLDGFDWRACTVGRMVDIWLALECQKRRVGMTCLARPADWIGYQRPQTPTIWRELSKPGADQAQTEVLNRHPLPMVVL